MYVTVRMAPWRVIVARLALKLCKWVRHVPSEAEVAALVRFLAPTVRGRVRLVK
jgi:hypothetical protein